jgi:hypothetical protein
VSHYFVTLSSRRRRKQEKYKKSISIRTFFRKDNGKWIPLIDKRVKAILPVIWPFVLCTEGETSYSPKYTAPEHRKKNFVYCQANLKSFCTCRSPILVNSPQNSPRKLLNYPPFCKFYTNQVWFNFLTYEIIRHFDWSPGLIRGTGPKKVENIPTFYYPASSVAGSIRINNYRLGHARILSCYPVLSLFSKLEISL